MPSSSQGSMLDCRSRSQYTNHLVIAFLTNSTHLARLKVNPVILSEGLIINDILVYWVKISCVSTFLIKSSNSIPSFSIDFIVQ